LKRGVGGIHRVDKSWKKIEIELRGFIVFEMNFENSF
jgi:hypothetical protein